METHKARTDRGRVLLSNRSDGLTCADRVAWRPQKISFADAERCIVFLSRESAENSRSDGTACDLDAVNVVMLDGEPRLGSEERWLLRLSII